jgi:ferrous iron transport protein B
MTATAEPRPTTAPAIGLRYVALAGNPNCGKTTLFNALTGLRHRVGNYAGVTVERREGRLSGTDVTILDLPGTYSLNARSPDEEIARDVLLGRFPPVPELVLVVIDASNLERNLYLVSQVMDLGVPVAICLNMVDVAEKMGLEIDAAALSRELGVPVLPTVARKGHGLEGVRKLLSGSAPARPERRWRLPDAMAVEVEALAALLEREQLAPAQGSHFAAVALLSDPRAGTPAQAIHDPALQNPQVRSAVEAALTRLEAVDIDAQSAPVEARYEWISGVVERCSRQGAIPVTWSDRLDAVATHRVWGFVLFFLLMALMFQAIYTWANVPADWIELGQNWLGAEVGQRLPEGDLKSLLVDGIIGGVGGVLVFMPQILLLFFFIGLLEDTGYMARAAFVMDRVMSKVGLHGKSFIPLLSSFACAIPGIMATRTIENKRDRMVTILVAPLMSCSARIPVYTVLIAAFIPDRKLWGFLSLAGIVTTSMYLLGLGAALVMALLFKKTLFKGETPLFLMELPPYKLPAPKTVLLQTWERGYLFLQKAGTVILATSILLWFIMHFPGHPGQSRSERLQGSVAGHAGRAIEPVIRPFGMDWKVGIGILGSFAAREVFVSTMAIVYNVDDAADDDQKSISVRDQMRAEKDPVTGRPRFTALSACALMVFYVLAMQCVSTMAVVRRETGSWKWPLFQWVYMFVLAWAGATLVYQLGRLLGFG